ncbi:MAG: hypothetical protein FJ095_11250 [Deltaproteobacteria bacterium]|nr:hypothetical protein [Deltaproteobacteria bacterium]
MAAVGGVTVAVILGLRVIAPAMPAASGTLVINAERDGKPVDSAHVSVDGRPVCTLLPCRVKDVEPGWREVRVESGALARSEAFEVRRDRNETEVTVRLVATAGATSSAEEAPATTEHAERLRERERLKAKLRALEEQSDERGSMGGGRSGKPCKPGDPLCSDDSDDVRAVPSPDALRRRLKSEAEAARNGCAPDDLMCLMRAGAKRRP